MPKAKDQNSAYQGLRRKRQVEGKRHGKRVDLYFSTEEKEMVRKAAQQAGVSMSQYCTVAALRKAKQEIISPDTDDFEPVVIPGEPLSETILRERR